jgi:hypothetical protein
MELGESLRGGDVLVGADYPGSMGRGRVRALDQAVAGGREARIDAQDEHMF